MYSLPTILVACANRTRAIYTPPHSGSEVLLSLSLSTFLATLVDDFFAFRRRIHGQPSPDAATQSIFKKRGRLLQHCRSDGTTTGCIDSRCRGCGAKRLSGGATLGHRLQPHCHCRVEKPNRFYVWWCATGIVERTRGAIQVPTGGNFSSFETCRPKELIVRWGSLPAWNVVVARRCTRASRFLRAGATCARNVFRLSRLYRLGKFLQGLENKGHVLRASTLQSELEYRVRRPDTIRALIRLFLCFLIPSSSHP